MDKKRPRPCNNQDYRERQRYYEQSNNIFVIVLQQEPTSRRVIIGILPQGLQGLNERDIKHRKPLYHP
jgi:hypothetical protein